MAHQELQDQQVNMVPPANVLFSFSSVTTVCVCQDLLGTLVEMEVEVLLVREENGVSRGCPGSQVRLLHPEY